MNTINTTIFKAYDIRGTYPDQLNEDVAYKIGFAYAQKISGKHVVFGRDMRLASPQLSEKFIEGMIDAGVLVHDIGLVPVDGMYFALGSKSYDGGVYCTASHNPKEYHGFKMLDGNFNAIRGTDLKEVVISDDQNLSKEKGGVQKVDIMKDFIDYISTFADLEKIKPFNVVIDAGNGMAGKTIPPLAKRLPIKVTEMNFELDGNFPSHPSNPLEPQSQEGIIKKVKELNADLGVIFDGDSDRVFFVDEKGRFCRADIALIILAKYYLKKNPGASVVYNAICTKGVKEFTQKWGGKAFRSKVGSVNVREVMMKHEAVVGGELSAHYMFKDNFYSDSGYIAFLNVLQILSEDGRPLSELVDELTTYYRGDEINLPIKDSGSILQKIKERFSDGKIDELDGVTVEYRDFWFSVRASNTEPLLRVTVEADTKEILEKKQKEVVDFIASA